MPPVYQFVGESICIFCEVGVGSQLNFFGLFLSGELELFNENDSVRLVRLLLSYLRSALGSYKHDSFVLLV